MKKLILTSIILMLIGFNMPAEASVTYWFTQPVESGDSPGELAIAETQFSMEIEEYSSVHIMFTFSNTSYIDSSITNIYFADESVFRDRVAFFDASQDVGDSGVDFSRDSQVTGLPGTEVIDFEPTIALSADVDSAMTDGGINPGESLSFIIPVRNHSVGFSDVLEAIDDGQLRIAMYVQGFPDGGNAVFNRPIANPVPGSVILAGIGVGFVGWLRSRKMF